MAECTIEYVQDEQWHALAPRFLDHGYQQCWAYAHALAQRRGAACECVAIRRGSELLGVTSVRIRRVPVLGSGIAYISGGPLTRTGDAGDAERLKECLGALEEEYVRRRGVLLRVLLPVGRPAWNARVHEALRSSRWSCAQSARKYRTFLLDIARPLEEIRAGCSKYWRRNLRRGEQRSFTIRSCSGTTLLPELIALYERLTRRKTFDVSLGASFYAGLQRHLHDEEQFLISIIDLDGKAVAGLAVSMLGDTAVPVVLATDEHGLRNYAAYVLQWHSIETAVARGMQCYDLGGIDPEANPGVYNFKQGLRGEDITAPGPYEAAPGAARRMIIHSLERLHRKAA